MYGIFSNGISIYEPGNDKMRLISPKLTVEMGKAGSLQFGLPPTNEYYNSDVQQLKTILSVTQDGNEIFRGRVLNKKRNMNNIMNVYGEGDLAYLVDSVQKAKKYSGKAHALFREIIAAHNAMIGSDDKKFTVGNITVENRDVLLVGQSDEDSDIYEDAESTYFNAEQIAINSIAEEWQNTYDYIESTLIEYCGGYLRTRRVGNVTYIDWLKDYFGTSNQVVEFSKNILDLSEEFNPEDAFSVLIPLGEENLTIEKASYYKSEGIVHNINSVEIVDTNAVSKYGRIVKTNVFDGVTDAATLLENGIRYLKTNSTVPVTIEVRAVDLHFVDPSIQTIKIGDKVQIRSPGHSIDRNDLVCTKIEYDLANPGNTVYTFGNPKQTLTERYRKDKKKQDEQAGRSGRGGGGGGGKATRNNAKEDGLDFYKAWFNVDNDHAMIDFGTLFKRLYPDKDLTQITGKTQITMVSNAERSGISLYADHNEFADYKDKFNNQTTILSARCGIDLNAYVDENGLTHAVTNITSIYEDATKHSDAQLKLTADKLGSRIDLKADKVTVDSQVFQINTTVGKHTKQIAAFSDKLTEIDSELTIITGALTVGEWVTSSKAVAAPYFFRGNIEIGLHTHKIGVAIDGTVSIGTVNKWGEGVSNSFKIADTKYYKDKVKALTVTSLDLTSNITNDGKRYHIVIDAKNEKGDKLKTRTYYTTSDVYNNGVNSVDIDSVSHISHGSSSCKVSIKLTNGVTKTKTVSW